MTDSRINIRASAEDIEMIRRAAQMERMSVTSFMLNLAISRARVVLGDAVNSGVSELVGTTESPKQEVAEKVQPARPVSAVVKPTPRQAFESALSSFAMDEEESDEDRHRRKERNAPAGHYWDRVDEKYREAGF